jgi:hypothetical protein
LRKTIDRIHESTFDVPLATLKLSEYEVARNPTLRSSGRELKAALLSHIDEALVFRVSFERGTSFSPHLEPARSLSLAVAKRMLFQLQPEKTMGFQSFLMQPEFSKATMGEVISASVKLVKPKFPCVIILIDGVQNIVIDDVEPHQRSVDFIAALRELSQVLSNASPAFPIIAVAATTQSEMTSALGSIGQKRVAISVGKLSNARDFFRHELSKEDPSYGDVVDKDCFVQVSISEC